MTSAKEIDMKSMGSLRQASQKISGTLHKRLNGYLQTLSPLFAPRKVLGEFMESAFKERVPGADANFIALEETFKTLARETFDIPAKLSTPVPNIRNLLEIHPWEYRYLIGCDPERPVIITSPVRWTLSYAGGTTLSDVMKHQAREELLEADDLKQFIVRTLTLNKLLDTSPSIQQMLADLRFPVGSETASATGDLPLNVVGSDLATFRPQDELIETVIQLSGKPVFEELIDLDAIETLPDPFKVKITEMLG
jgi:hypothetical protein